MTVDFKQIRSGFAGQRESFEDFVCQLARRNPPAHASCFYRIEGSGGDGGVECYWTLVNGTKTGYQAKYFTKAGEIDWAQIDSSVQQALSTHCDLVSYVIAVACDLTGKVGAKGRGKSGWEQWADHRAKWLGWAASLGMSVDFILWAAFDLREMLSVPSAAGLRLYWFNELEFSFEWLQSRFASAVASLDERYHPEDHVDVRTEEVFSALVRQVGALESLLKSTKILIGRNQTEDIFKYVGSAPPLEMCRGLDAGLAALAIVTTDFKISSWAPFPYDHWKALNDQAMTSARDVLLWCYEKEEDAGKEKKSAFAHARQQIGDIADALSTFSTRLSSAAFKSEKAGALLLTGPAGCGKSHLLAHIAERLLSKEIPAILFLGQQFRSGDLWTQLANRLGLPGRTGEEILGALDAAAERRSQKGLLLIDALNEGAGRHLWRDEVAALLLLVSNYKNLAIVLSCRTEYVHYTLPQAVLAHIPRIEIHGFETAEEQRAAAIVYLDKRGITRPAAPWLAPEFVNPLFLRSVCNALQLEGKSEFPKGLSGTKRIFSFYIDSVAKNLHVGRDGSTDLVAPTREVLLHAAAEMAAKRQDWLSRDSAEAIAREKFRNFPLPESQTWFEVLQRSGLFRIDPDPSVDYQDALSVAGDVVRFSFQRFQDHLMAQSLLNNIPKAGPQLFASKGSLSFLMNGMKFNPKWSGLLASLAIQIPEKYGEEAVDLLPQPTSQWLSRYEIKEAIYESIRWREAGSFRPRTLEIFNQVNTSWAESVVLLLELSLAEGHPWNGDFLHKNLRRLRLPKRDSLWTMSINDVGAEEFHPISRLIDWCGGVESFNPSEETLRLAGLVICWCFTASNREVRDKATKALTSILLKSPQVFATMVSLFRGVDDMYILERIWAAGFASCCLDPSEQRLADYADEAEMSIFAAAIPPANLLLRDYARTIVELAEAAQVRRGKLSMDRIRPPYRSEPPDLSITEKDVEAVARTAGGEQILYSSLRGDFARYEIESALDGFSAVELTKRVPETSQKLTESFEAEVIGSAPVLRELYEKWNDSKMHNTFARILGKSGEAGPQPDYSASLNALKLALDATGRRRLNKLVRAPRSRWDLPRIDLVASQCWVANQAYKLGWSSKLFAHESGSGAGYSRDRASTERIGKKYQWIALSELLCLLADNYWLVRDDTKVYENPTDLGFQRDIEPTLLGQFSTTSAGCDAWVFEPTVSLSIVEEETLPKWPFERDTSGDLSRLPIRQDPSGETWSVLYEHANENEHYVPRQGEHGLRQQEFRFLACIVVRSAERADAVNQIAALPEIVIMDWDPPEHTDGPYFFEAPWRNTWPQEKWRREHWRLKKPIEFGHPIFDFFWESHLDASLPQGARAYLPAPWLWRELGLRARRSANEFVGPDGKVLMKTYWRNGQQVVLINTNALASKLALDASECVWLYLGERGAWPKGSNSSASWRRTYGVAWCSNGVVEAKTWSSDGANGSSRDFLKSA